MLRMHGWLFCSLLISSALSGCGPNLPPGAKPTKPVKATFTYKGAAVAGADVMFIYQGNEPISAVGKTDAQGVAKLKTYVEGDGAVLGSHKVTVIKDEIIGEAKSVDQNSPDYAPPTGKEPPTQIKHHVPVKYGSWVTTDLTAEVTSGANDLKFELKD
jgi:hypothetical protein